MIKDKLILLFLLIVLVSVCAAQTEYGIVNTLEGRLFRIRATGTDEVGQGDIVFIDDKLRTGESSYAEIRFKRKNYQIDENTEFTLREISTPSREQQKEVAKVDFIMGILELIETDPVVILKAGEHLKVGDVIRTGNRSYAEIVYGEKILVKVDQNTTLEIKEFKKEKKTLKQILGKIWVKAKKMVAEKFEVETRFGTAGVRGTQFGISVDFAGGLEVDCEEGSVYMISPSGEEIEIPAGMKCGIKTDGSLKDIKTRNPEEGFEKFGLPEDDSLTPEIEKAVKDLKLLLGSISLKSTGEKYSRF